LNCGRLTQPPRSTGLTAYDRQHATTYLRLLDAEQAGAEWRDVARHIFRVDPNEDPARFERMHRAHLERAHWVREHGYQEVAQSRPLSS
jgi:predicted secreted protein